MNLIYLKGGKNCKTDEVPFHYETMKGWLREGRYPGVVFKIANKLVFDTDAWSTEVEQARKINIKEAAAKRRIKEACR